MIEIEKYSAVDREGVRDVCFSTGFLGRSLEGIVDGRELFLDLATFYFLDVDSSGVFVAKDNGKVAGYVFVSDRAGYTAFARGYFVRRTAAWLLKFWRISGKDAKYYYRFFLSFLRGEMRMPPLSQFPAALHINVAEPYQRAGVGSMLFNAMFAYLQQVKCKGVLLHTTSANEKGTMFFKKHGFEELLSIPSGFYKGWGMNDVKNIVMGKRL